MAQPSWDILWGSTLEDVQIDLLQGIVTIAVVMPSGDHSNRFSIEASGVRALRYFNDIELPWSYAELTEVHVHESGGGVAIDVVLWNEGAGIHVDAVAAELTGS